MDCYMTLYILICMYADSLLKSRAKCWRQIGRVWYGVMYLLFPAKDVWLTSASLRALSCWMEASSHASSWTQDKREIMSNSCDICKLVDLLLLLCTLGIYHVTIHVHSWTWTASEAKIITHSHNIIAK